MHSEGVRHHRLLLGGLDDGVRDQVGEGDLLRPPRRLERSIQSRAAAPPALPTGSSRKVVAVGTVRLSVMLATSLAAGPFIGWAAGQLGSGEAGAEAPGIVAVVLPAVLPASPLASGLPRFPASPLPL